MGIFDLYSKRQRKARGDVPDVFSYDELPHPLRVQIVHILKDTIGEPTYGGHNIDNCYQHLTNILCKEYGVFRLGGETYGPRNFFEEFLNFILQEKDVERALDAIELGCIAIDKVTRDFSYLHRQTFDEKADDALSEINQRFKEHGVGFQFESGEIIRVDSQFIHQEAVKPALHLLNSKRFAGAQEEFLKAHEHYRKQNTKEALNEALKAFESTLKVIAKKRGWKLKERPTSKDLIDAAFTNGLIPSFWQSHFSGLRSVLEGGVPTGRNRLSGHGQGDAPQSVPDELAAYILHLTASTIVFLVRCDEAMK